MNGESFKRKIMIKEDIYKILYEKLKSSNKEIKKISGIKRCLESSISNSLNPANNTDYLLKYIGSTETETSLKGSSDIDLIIGIHPYDSKEFKRILYLNKEINNLNLRENVNIVRDIATGSYYGIKVGFIGLDHHSDPSYSLEGDVLNHPDFSKVHLNNNQKREVILTKLFFKNLEIKNRDLGGGFSTEQIIAYFGNFEEFLNYLSLNKPIFIDYSKKFNGERSNMTISYPFCGLKNMSWRFSEEQFKRSVDYAKRILSDPEIFLEDSLIRFNKNLWVNRGQELSDKLDYSTPDIFLSKIENRFIRNKLSKIPFKSLLDVGCGNGFSTRDMTYSLKDKIIIGIDNNPLAIKNAINLVKHNKSSKYTFINANLDSLNFKEGQFDIIIAKRFLCNIPSDRLKEETIKKMSSFLDSKGYLFIFDLIQEGYTKTNNIRKNINLEELTQPNHTLIPKEKDIIQMAESSSLKIDKIYDPTSTYYASTRILYPFLRKIFKKEESNIRFDSFLHRLPLFLPPMFNLGVDKLYIFKKK
ncbi:methyltransferase domain-containing protein [Candidatus Woesearchaeota archaeon]|nr:methyltransferase domain-containing protein [Candidatus Woesearchaeota archaeon]